MTDKDRPEVQEKTVVTANLGISIEIQGSVQSKQTLPIESTYRPRFIAAMTLLAEAFDDVVKVGFPRPIIVGGAAVEFYTGGAVASGDFDVVTEAQRQLEAALLRRGFERPSGRGVLLRGLHHPALGYGVEVVSGDLFDGASDGTRVRIVSLGAGEVRMPPVEDMIADRMGQFCAPYNLDKEMLDQAIILYQIAKFDLEKGLDEGYLDRRIKHETAGACDLRFLKEKASDARSRKPSQSD